MRRLAVQTQVEAGDALAPGHHAAAFACRLGHQHERGARGLALDDGA